MTDPASAPGGTRAMIAKAPAVRDLQPSNAAGIG
jgi:hypothetical protein